MALNDEELESGLRSIAAPVRSRSGVVVAAMDDDTDIVSGSGSLEQAGAGTLTLSGTNTYGSGTTLSAGTLALGSAGAISSGGTLSFTGGTLQFSSSNTTDYSARFSAAAGQSYRFDTNNQAVTLASPLTSDGGSLAKLGAGTLTLSGDNTYTGGTTLSAGTLVLGSAKGVGTTGIVTLESGATFDTAALGFDLARLTGWKVDRYTQTPAAAAPTTAAAGPERPAAGLEGEATRQPVTHLDEGEAA